MSPNGKRFLVRFSEGGERQERQFDTIEEARTFRQVRGQDERGARVSPQSRAALAQNAGARLVPQYGNAHGKTHGGTSVVTEEEIQAQMELINADRPIQTIDLDQSVVRLLADQMIRYGRMITYEQRHEIADRKGATRPVSDGIDKIAGRILELFRELGMTPKSRAALNLDVARGLEAIANTSKLLGAERKNPIDTPASLRRAAALVLLSDMEEREDIAQLLLAGNVDTSVIEGTATTMEEVPA